MAEPAPRGLRALLAGLGMLAAALATASCAAPAVVPAALVDTAAGAAALAPQATWTPEPWKLTATAETVAQVTATAALAATQTAAPTATPTATRQPPSPVARATATPSARPSPLAVAPTTTAVILPPPVADRPAIAGAADSPAPAIADASGGPWGSRALIADPELAALVDTHFRGLRGVFGVAIKDLDSGRGALVWAERELPAASLFKLPVMYEVYRQRADGRLSFAVPLVLTAQFAQYDLGTLDLPVGGTVSVAGALERMIMRSDNSTANLLLNRVGVPNVNGTMHELGLDATRITGERLTTSARDMLAFLEMLALDEDPYTPSSAEMLLLLLGQRVNDRLPARLPPDTPVAHKTGNLEDIVHDVGIVYSPGATFVIALLAADVTDLGQVTRAEAALTRAVYDYFNPADAALRSALRAPTGAARPTPRPTPQPTPITLPAADSLAAAAPELVGGAVLSSPAVDGQAPVDDAVPLSDPLRAAPAPLATATPRVAAGSRVVRCFYSAC